MIRIVLDTNVLVSAVVFGGIPRAVFELAETGQCEFFHSQAIQGEVRRVLAEKFDWSQPMIRAVLPVIWRMGKRVTAACAIHAVPDDPDDDGILECAFAAHAEFIVSGDHHLLGLHEYNSIAIVTPRQFMKLFEHE